jgi:signal transduction histidine kinase
MSELVANIEVLLKASFAERGITYRSEMRPGEPTLAADPELLSQAILNLLRNAADAVEEVDQPAILLSCKASGREIVLTVSDNGPGIPAERLQEIFVPFYTTRKSGSGIGLTLARQIALAHGGRIEAENNPGGGALFRMILPARR